jgi:hypothetical protein
MRPTVWGDLQTMVLVVPQSSYEYCKRQREKSLPLLKVQTPLPWLFCLITLLIKFTTNKTQCQELYITFLASNYGKSTFITKYWGTQNTTEEHNTLTDWRMGEYISYFLFMLNTTYLPDHWGITSTHDWYRVLSALWHHAIC